VELVAESPLTDRQLELLDFIIDYLSKNDCQPSLREMGKFMGIKNVNGVVCHIDALEAKGYVKRKSKNVSRSRCIDWSMHQSLKKGRRRKA
jgi:SOS-response transcriptional repressor LexA